jgi:hypothetical protein
MNRIRDYHYARQKRLDQEAEEDYRWATGDEDE